MVTQFSGRVPQLFKTNIMYSGTEVWSPESIYSDSEVLYVKGAEHGGSCPESKHLVE